MKLYWSPRSPFVRKVMVCAHELDVADRIERLYALVSMSATNPAVMQANPLGRIPALVTDDGMALYDSVVICEYLDARYGESRLFPADLDRRWDCLRRHALADGLLETLVLWRSEGTRDPSRQSREVLAAFGVKAQSALDAAEREAAHLADAEIDIGHIALGAALGYLDFRYGELGWRTGRPHLSRWFESFGARPSMRKTAHEDELAKS